MLNTIIYLIGHQGVGKLTIAREISRETGAVVVDNHLIANPIFAAVAIDRSGKIPDSVKAKVAVVRSAVFAAIAEDARSDQSFVLTDVLLDDESSRRRFRETLDLAGLRRASLVPVRLRCEDDDEYARRVTDPARDALLKQTELAISLERRRSRPLLPLDHPNLLDLDVGGLAATEAARLVVDHAQGTIA